MNRKGLSSALFSVYTDSFRSLSSFSGRIEAGGKTLRKLKSSDLNTVLLADGIATDAFVSFYEPNAPYPFTVEYEYEVSYRKGFVSFPAFIPVSAPDVAAVQDNPIMKIDAGSDDLVRKINMPVGAYRLDKVVESLRRFNGNFVLQTMFLTSKEFDTTAPEALAGWMDIVRELKPREIMIYTIDRETPDKTLGKYTVQQMKALVQPLLDEGFNIQIRG